MSAHRPIAVLVAGRNSRGLAERLRSLVPEVDYHLAETAAEGEVHLAAVDAAVMATRITPAYLAAPRLRWLHVVGAGADQFSIPGLRDAPFAITHKVEASVIPMAEHVLGQVLLFARRSLEYHQLQQQRRWAEHGAWPTTALHQLHGSTLGLIGLGGSGLAVARRAKAFGMRVIGVKRQAVERLPDVDVVYPPAALREMLAEADFVAVLVPLTDATRGLIGTRELRAMKPTAYLINISRGLIVDEEAVRSALTNGWIAGASLDVFEHEPLPPDSPLWTTPNLIITPHCGGVGPKLAHESTQEIAANLRRFIAGRPLRHLLKREDIITTFEAPGH